jgi:hypothetical protein
MRKTRHQIATEVLSRVKRGPIFSASPGSGDAAFSPEQAADAYALWAKTWVVPDLEELLARDLAPRIPK